MAFDFNLLSSLLVSFFLPFFRIAAFFSTSPIFGNQLVPVRIRLLLSLAVTLVVFKWVDIPSDLSALSFMMVLTIFQQVIIGIVLGLLAQIFFHIFVLAGQMIAMQMGLGFASMVDPTNGVSVVVISQFYIVFVTLLFVAMNGHLVAIEVLTESFNLLPIGSNLSSNGLWYFADKGVWLFASAFLLALPAVTAILIVNFAFGVMTRAAPQLNIFSLGFPFTLVFGVFIFWVALSNFLPQYLRLSEELFAHMHTLMKA